MTTRTLVRLGRVVFAFVAACLVANIVLALVNATGPQPTTVGLALANISFYLAMFTFAIAGVVVVGHQPRNPIGWLLLLDALAWELPAEEMVRWGVITAPGAVPRPDVWAAATASLWAPGVGLIGTFLLLLFPDGHLPSPRWRPVAWLAGASIVGITVVIPLAPVSLRDTASYTFLSATAPNPLGVTALSPFVDALYTLVLLLPLSIGACAVGLVVRFRRARGRERQQLKWLAVSGVVVFGVYGTVMVLTSVFGGAGWNDTDTPRWLSVLQTVNIFVLVLVPIAVAVAILRHRLYDIDVLINRALVYVSLTATLAAVYTGGVLAAGTMVRVLSGQERSSLVVAGSTLVVAALFTPLRVRIQALIDRRFYRRRYDAQRAAADFALRLRNQVDLVGVRVDLVSTVAMTIQPTTASVWLAPTPLTSSRTHRRSPR